MNTSSRRGKKRLLSRIKLLLQKGGTLALNNGFDYREQIDNPDNGLTVLEYLTRTYRHSSRPEWQKRLENGQVYLDELPAQSDTFVRSGQLLVWRRPPWDEPDVPLTYSVLHEDEDLLAVAKPSGLPTMPGGGFLEHTLLSLVRARRPEAAPIHRLGRGTSGIVLFARTPHARSALSSAMRRNELIKIYRALAAGIPDLDNFTIEAPIGPVPHPKLGYINAATPDGKSALSRFRVLETRRDTTLLEARIETGRPHQIRIHLAFAGHPLVGDPLYSAGGGIKDPDALPGDPGYLLHAECIRFRHPATHSDFEIKCAPPPQLEMVKI